MEDESIMKKSLLMTIILPTAVCAILILGIFIGRSFAGHRFEISKGQSTETTVEWASDGKLNINLATSEMLQILPGIGPSLAQRIIDYREENGPFTNIEELKNVSGIGNATFNKIKDYVMVD